MTELQIQFLYECNQRNVPHDDLGYIIKDIFSSTTDGEFLNKILDRCLTNFFDHPKKIKSIVHNNL